MGSVLIVAGPGSGLTTFVGLLYTAQVRYGTEHGDTFRFHADRESIQMLQEIYGDLGAGTFPLEDVDWEHRPLSFLFGFRRGRFSFPSHRTGQGDDEFDVLPVRVAGVQTAEVLELESHDAVLEDATRQLLRSPVVVPLVDATWLRPEDAQDPASRVRRYDVTLSGTLTLLARFLAASSRRRERRMFPLFVVTKFDQMDDGSLRDLGGPVGPTEGWTSEARADFGQRLLGSYFPRTAEVIAGRLPPGVRLDAPAWFFSGLELEERPGGRPRIRRRQPSPIGGWEPAYPFAEFRGLLEHLAGIAHRLPPETGG